MLSPCIPSDISKSMSASAFAHSFSAEVKICEAVLSQKKKKRKKKEKKKEKCQLPVKCGARHNWPLFRPNLCKTLAASMCIRGISGIIPSKQVETCTFWREWRW